MKYCIVNDYTLHLSFPRRMESILDQVFLWISAFTENDTKLIPNSNGVLLRSKLKEVIMK